jgi:hypothetical protein
MWSKNGPFIHKIAKISLSMSRIISGLKLAEAQSAERSAISRKKRHKQKENRHSKVIYLASASFVRT